MALRAASLFAGVGGLDLALRIASPGSETVVYLERDAYAAATLVARMEDAVLDQAPIWDDIETFDGAAWRGCVDLVMGGFPCVDISCAGRGEGIREGNRSGLWFEMLRVICEIRPRYVFLENVSAITVRGLDVVLGSLAEVGFDAEWLCLRASDVGAPHQRERWFCLAYRDSVRFPQCDESEKASGRGSSPALCDSNAMANPENNQPREAGTGSQERVAVGGTGADVEHTTGGSSRGAGTAYGEGSERFAGEPDRELADAGRERHVHRGHETESCALVSSGDQELADAVRCGSGPRADDGTAGDRNHKGMRSADDGGGDLADTMRGRYHHTKEEICTRGHAAFPPGPADAEAWQRILEDRPWLAPAVKSGVRVRFDESSMVVDENRSDQLRCCGNGVVPLQAAAALVELFRRVRKAIDHG